MLTSFRAVAFAIALASTISCGGAIYSAAPDDTVARTFASGIVSRGHQFMASFTPDQRTVYFSQRIYVRQGELPQLTILESKVVDGRWSEPVPAAFSGTWRDIDPVVAPSGGFIVFNSQRPAPGRDSAATDYDIWTAERTASGWAAPRRLPAPINTRRSEFFASVTRDGTFYFTIGGSVPRTSQIVRSRRLGPDAYSPPETLTVINASGNASNPFIPPDESYLIFAAERPEGHGDSDLYVSRREGATWSAPRNLGPRVNTPLSEFASSVSPTGGRSTSRGCRAASGRQ